MGWVLFVRYAKKGFFGMLWCAQEFPVHLHGNVAEGLSRAGSAQATPAAGSSDRKGVCKAAQGRV